MSLLNPTVSERVGAQLQRALGPAMLAALTAPDAIEVMRNPDGALVTDTQHGRQVIGAMDELQAELIIATVAALHHRIANAANPVVEAELTIGKLRTRFTGVLPPLAAAATISIRVPSVAGLRLEDYVTHGLMTARQADILRRAVGRERLNILLAGMTGSGKTTLANALLAEIDGEERVINLEELSELRRPGDRHTVYLRTTAEHDLGSLVRTTMRLKPDRIVVGEVRGAEALAMLKAWLTGHPGGIATIHAGSVAGALMRLDALAQEAGVPSQARLIAETTDLVAVVGKTPEGRPGALIELARVTGYDPAQGARVEPVEDED